MTSEAQVDPTDTGPSAADQLRALLQAGLAAVQRGQRDRATGIFEAALVLDPKCDEALVELAALASDPDEARVLYLRALEANPDNPAAHAALRVLEATEPSVLADELSSSVENAAALVTTTEDSDSVAPALDAVADSQPTPSEDERHGSSAAQQLAPAIAVTAKATTPPPRATAVRRLVDHEAPAARRTGRNDWLKNALMLGMLALVAFGGASLILLGRNPTRTHQVRAALGIFTPTPTYTPTNTPTATATATPTSTPTATPTVTPTATITPTPSPTPTPAWMTSKYLPLPLDEKWIEVDLSTQMLYAYEGHDLVFSTEISSGRAGTQTPQGKFRIQSKFHSQTMAGAGFYLPNVTWVQYFVGANAFHTAYWHNNFGQPMSHGCINMREADAKWLYDWTSPSVPEGSKSVQATASSLGTWVLVHK
jgi:lipoprotein-anchoring transpeptidase ErfK/SrfK